MNTNDIKQNHSELISESDFFIATYQNYQTNEGWVKDNFQENLKKYTDYLSLCIFMGYNQVNELICEYAENIRNYNIVYFNDFLDKNKHSPIWNHWELIEQKNLDEVIWFWMSRNPAAIPLLEKEIGEAEKKGRDSKVHWADLSRNPAAIPLLEKEIGEAEKKGRDSKVHWIELSKNPAAIHLLEKNLSEVFWYALSENPGAIHLLEKEIKESKENNRDCRVDWVQLSSNPAAIHILEKNLKKVDWSSLSRNPAAIHILEQNPNKIDWKKLSRNPAAIPLLEKEIWNAKKQYRQPEIVWFWLSGNPAAIHLLEKEIEESKEKKRPCMVNWNNLTLNPAAIYLLEKEIVESKEENRGCRVEWNILSGNPAAIHLLREKIKEEKGLSSDQYKKLKKEDKVSWEYFSSNEYQYLKEKLIALEKMGVLSDSLNTKTILQTYIQCLKKKERYDDYIIYSN